MLQQAVQTAVEAVFAGGLEVHVQQLIHRTAKEPLAVQAVFAAGIDEPMDGQKLQDLLPGHFAAGVLEPRLPEAIQFQLLPKPAAQPAVAEASRPQQLHLRELDLKGVEGVGRNGAVVGEQGQLLGLLVGAVEDVQCLSPGRLLGIVDLSEIQDRALGDMLAIDAAAGDAAVLDDAEVAVLLAVLPSLVRLQEHAPIVRPSAKPGKGAGLHYSRLTHPSDGTTGTYARK